MHFTSLVNPPADVDGAGRLYVVRGSEVLVTADGRIPERPVELEQSDRLFLGCLDGVPCWAAGVPAEAPEPDAHRWAPLMALGAAWGTDEWALAGRAVQLVDWQRTSRFCGGCGAAMVPSPGERAMRCDACGHLAYPVLAPAVIVLIRKGEQALLAAGRNFRGGMFSCLAGFVEPGETLEEAVRREVLEEVGLRLGSVEYFSSQPWPFPHSLMIGFVANWESGEITADGDEIVAADWFSADELPPIPPPLSIARQLIDHWAVPPSAG
ncbi:MAG: NAD(+) diphosphatase [Acidimicrobiaceae bacterium]|nr:NAD(+) diphosphatase [Acidimicrobiaceae bacterium]